MRQNERPARPGVAALPAQQGKLAFPVHRVYGGLEQVPRAHGDMKHDCAVASWSSASGIGTPAKAGWLARSTGNISGALGVLSHVSPSGNVPEMPRLGT
jgi:hypothetical protein